MDPVEIIKKYAPSGSLTYEMLVQHSSMVRDKALTVAEGVLHLGPDLAFISEASMLHDIGIVLVYEPRLECAGTYPYICHGYLGSGLLEKEGFPRHALVCERHIGTGLTVHDIESQGLPLPKRDMLPRSLEEKIICYADKFFSKRVGKLSTEKSLAEVRREMEKFGQERREAFDELHALFSKKPSPGKDLKQER
ncbi:MAG TPA: phosphohydrolase [Thermodesulfovibrionales bacterium]|nr:phosphohydrolase [Thermodesulfovibrionales bacterium]